jgi:hypothetical protein
MCTTDARYSLGFFQPREDNGLWAPDRRHACMTVNCQSEAPPMRSCPLQPSSR